MACNSSNSTGIRVEPMNLFFGKKNKSCISPIAVVPESASFKFSSKTTKYYAYYDNGAAVDPAFVGYTGILVDVSAATTIEEVVIASKDAIELVATDCAVTISEDGLSLAIEVLALGPVLEATVDVDTTFAIETDVVGFGGALGYSEDIDVSFETSTFDVTSSQTGETKLTTFVTGVSCEVSTSLLGTSKEQWENLVGNGIGATYTPSMGDAVTGFGSDSIGKDFYTVAGTLVLHPVALADNDYSRDVTIPKCAALPSSITYSGTDKSSFEVTFSALLDTTLNGKINLMHFGSGSTTQNLSK
jgi:hypothetical protein